MKLFILSVNIIYLEIMHHHEYLTCSVEFV